jgi:hypothetical protein
MFKIYVAPFIMMKFGTGNSTPKFNGYLNKTGSNIEPDITRRTEAACAVKERLLMMGTTVPATC